MRAYVVPTSVWAAGGYGTYMLQLVHECTGCDSDLFIGSYRSGA